MQKNKISVFALSNKSNVDGLNIKIKVKIKFLKFDWSIKLKIMNTKEIHNFLHKVTIKIFYHS